MGRNNPGRWAGGYRLQGGPGGRERGDGRDSDVRHISIHGTHYEMGLRWGSLEEPSPTETGEQYAIEPEQGITWLCRFTPDLLDEFRGILDAPERREKQVGEILATSGQPDVGCSAFWVSPDHTNDGLPLVGRNWDYRPAAARNARIVSTRPVRGYAHLAFTNHPVGRYGGINEAGLAVATAVVPARKEEKGLPFTLAVRRMLEVCGDAAAGADFLGRVPIRSAVNFLLADATGAARVIEVEPGRIHPTEPVDFAAIGNHFPSIPPADARPRLPGSRRRVAALANWFREHSGNLDDTAAEHILSNRRDAICARGNPGIAHATVTLWSWIARPGKRALRAAAGSPHNTPYRPYNL